MATDVSQPSGQENGSEEKINDVGQQSQSQENTTTEKQGSDETPPKQEKKKRTSSLGIKKKPPGGYDSTPLPDAPPGYTVRFTFHSAGNIAPADIHNVSADPFLHATLKASGVKRHKEDPDLVHRTPTQHCTTKPAWQSEWVVANVPASGFTLKCRLYDEDSRDTDDRLGNVTVKVHEVYDGWAGIAPPGREFAAKKRVMSKRAFVLKAMSVWCHSGKLSALVRLSIEVLGKSDPPHGQMYTIGPTYYFQHFSPMIGRLTGTTIKKNEAEGKQANKNDGEDGQAKKYDFQANEMQLAGPVPAKLYHRFVEFRPIIASMFTSKGLRGKVLNMALHKQHNRIYNFDSSTEYASFEPCSKAAARQFLKLAHHDEGGRVFTYVLTLDSMFRFTETGKEFGIDLLSKHTMHSDVATYIACSGEFFIRRLEHPDGNDDPEPNEKTHPDKPVMGGPPYDDPPTDPSYYQLVIDNDSGTYRPDKSVLPELKSFLEKNFPGLGVLAMHWEDKKLQKLKEAQQKIKKSEGQMIHYVMNRSQSSLSSDESELDSREAQWASGEPGPSKREAAFNAVEDPSKIKETIAAAIKLGKNGEGSKS